LSKAGYLYKENICLICFSLWQNLAAILSVIIFVFMVIGSILIITLRKRRKYMNLTKEMKRRHAALIKERTSIEIVLRGVEAYLDAVKTESAGAEDGHCTKKVDRVMRLPSKDDTSNVQKPSQRAESDAVSVFKWDA